MGSKVTFNPILSYIGTECVQFSYCPFCGEKIELKITTKVKE